MHKLLDRRSTTSLYHVTCSLANTDTRGEDGDNGLESVSAHKQAGSVVGAGL